MTATLNNKRLDALLAEAVYMVEADDFARLKLWEENHKRFKTWEEINPGHVLHLGSFPDGRPVIMVIWYNRLDGKVIGFYEVTSEVADWGLVNDFFKTRDKKTTNAINFGHALRELGH